MSPALFALLVLQAGAAHGVEPLLLAATVLHESGGHARLVTHERGGHCSVGMGQILVRGCARREVRRLLDPATNLDRAAALLAGAQRFCARHPRWRCCRVHWIGRYDCGSKGYAERVIRKWRWLLSCRRSEV